MNLYRGMRERGLNRFGIRAFLAVLIRCCSQGSGHKHPGKPSERRPRICVAVGIETPTNTGCETLDLCRIQRELR